MVVTWIDKKKLYVFVSLYLGSKLENEYLFLCLSICISTFFFKKKNVRMGGIHGWGTTFGTKELRTMS